MRLSLKTAVSALAIGCSLAAVSGPAQAYTLMDMFRGERGRDQSTIYLDEMPQGRAAKRDQAARRGGGLGDVDPEAAAPKISSPRYYTYKADPMRLVDTRRFDDPMVVGSVSSSPPASEAMPGRQVLMNAKVKAPVEVAAALESYYGDTAKPLVWIDANGVTDRAKSAMAALAQAGDVGLDPQDYAVDMPNLDPANPDPQARERVLGQFEIELSAKVLAYVQDTIRGRVDPNRISGYHDFKRKDVRLQPVLNILRLSPDIAAYLRSRDPQSPQFAALKSELVRLRGESGSEERISISLNGLVRPGDSSPEMEKIVHAIGKRGSADLKARNAATLSAYSGDDVYGPELVSLVEDFQKEHGLKPDGVIGNATIRLLTGGDSNGEKIEKLIVALEQARWLPDDLGSRYVFINQPAYMVYYHNNNQEQLSMRVVIGQPTHQTFFFQDQIETVEFNPFWGVPQSIIVNEMLPHLRQDPSYLDRMGYEVAVDGRAMSSSSVDWYGSTSNISVRQPPSGDNALGELKILFPNAHAIYMHDTPSKSFFKRDMRALSHGCVRLADPRAMAAAVLGTSVDQVSKEIATGKNHAVQVPQKIPVYVAYFTAWPNKNGTVDYFADVYGRDSYIEKAFQITSKARAEI